MPTENTSLKNITPAGDSNTTNEMVIGKSNTYQRTFLIVACSLLACNVLIVIAGKAAGYSIVYTGGFVESAGAFAEYQVDIANTALSKDMFGVGAVFETDESKKSNCPCGPIIANCPWSGCQK